MTKRIIAALLSLMIMFSVAMPLNVYGLNRDVENQTEFVQKILKNIFGFSDALDLDIDKAGTKVENKVFKNLHITKNVKNGKVILNNVIVTGELLIEGTGQNTILIEDSTINKIILNNEDGIAKIISEGNTNVDFMSLKSGAILEQSKLTGKGYKEISILENSSFTLKTDKKVSWASENNKVAAVSKSGLLTSKGIGETVISTRTSDGKKSEFCKITVDEPEIETIKILAIGNSFSNDAVSLVYDIAKSAEIDVVVANLNFNGCSLETHWKNASSNNAYYSYQKWTSSGMTSESKKTMDSVVLDEDWDYITLQQYSGYSGMYSTFQPYLNYLSSYIEKLAPDARLALNLTWAYASDCTHADFAYYRSSQNVMYKAIVSSYRQAASDSGIEILIPCGTAIQNARTSQNLNKIGDELTRDGFHLNEKTGRYVAGLTYFETLIVKEENIDKDIFEDVSFIPDKDADKNIVLNAKNAAMNAVKNPFKITNETQKAYRD